KNNPMEFYVGATDIMTGKCVYHKCFDGKDNDIKWMQASASMPMVSRPVVVDGHLLLDGGISDSVPYEYMENLGYNRNVIILTKPDGYIRKRGLESYMARLALFKYPVAAKAMFNRCEMYNHQMEEIKDRENNKTSFVIRPPQALGISRTENDPSELERVYRLGRNEAERRLPELRSFLDDI
ncbi:MAG: patatin family protein, partial [Lachnospiraceae bacterium]|nr:patatin family protein [Lachnospiraceae bacterium]